MKNTRNKLLLFCLASLLVMASCERQELVPKEKQLVSSQDNVSKVSDPHWETTDESTKAAILAELNEIAHPKPNSKVTAILAIQTYRGFRINYTSATPADIIAFVKKEIDQMYNVNLKPVTITNMATVGEINVVPTSRGGLFYTNGRVVITDFATYRRVKAGDGNVVFHECTHYYQDRFLPGGWNNTTNSNNWRAAVANKIYASGQYVLSNSAEYFAVNNEAYFTNTAREPYNSTRETSKDPNQARFIRSTF